MTAQLPRPTQYFTAFGYVLESAKQARMSQKLEGFDIWEELGKVK